MPHQNVYVQFTFRAQAPKLLGLVTSLDEDNETSLLLAQPPNWLALCLNMNARYLVYSATVYVTFDKAL